MLNRMMRGAVALLIAVAFTATVRADESSNEHQDDDAQRVTLADVPAAVRAVIEKHVGNGEIKKIDKEKEDGKIVYDVEAKKNGKDIELSIAEDGTILTSEESVAYASLPAAVRAAAEKKLGGPGDYKASKEIEDGKTAYEIEAKSNGKHITLKFSETGELLEEEKD